MLKIATIRKLPILVKRAKLIEDDVIDVHGRDSRFAYLGIDVDINGVLHRITIDIKKNR